MLIYESASISVTFFSNMAAYRGGFEDEDDEDSCMSCLDTTKKRCLVVNFHCATNFSLAWENDEIPGWKAGKFVVYRPLLERSLRARHTALNTCCRRTKCFRSFWSKSTISTVSLTKERDLFWARACLLYMHEPLLLTYLHFPSVFHNQRPGYCELLHSGRNQLILTWITTVQQDCFFDCFGVAIRYDWIKIDVSLKLGVLNYSSRPKLSLGSAHVKYGVWPGPKRVSE